MAAPVRFRSQVIWFAEATVTLVAAMSDEPAR